MSTKYGMVGSSQKNTVLFSAKPPLTTSNTNPVVPLKQLEYSKSLPIKGLTNEQIAEKRRKRLCFSCDEPYNPGHKCKTPHLFMLLPSEEEVEECEEEVCGELGHKDLMDEGVTHEAHITLHALSEHSKNNTIRILGMANGKFLKILIDSGSTHNFMDPKSANRLRATMQSTKPITVYVADGFKVHSNQECVGFHWTAQGEEFSNDFKILPLGGIDAVLGVQWLKDFNPTTFDFKELTLSFIKNGKTVVLQGKSESH